MRIVLRRALSEAIRARDAAAVSALRSALAAIENAEAVDGADVTASTGVGSTEVARRSLTDSEVQELVDAERTERLSTALEYDRLGQGDHAARLRSEAAVLSRHLPPA